MEVAEEDAHDPAEIAQTRPPEATAALRHERAQHRRGQRGEHGQLDAVQIRLEPNEVVAVVQDGSSRRPRSCRK
jgi:hypothetical protein